MSQAHPPQATWQGELWEICKWTLIIAGADFLATYASSYLGTHGNPDAEEAVRWLIIGGYSVMVVWVLWALCLLIVDNLLRRRRK